MDVYQENKSSSSLETIQTSVNRPTFPVFSDSEAKPTYKTLQDIKNEDNQIQYRSIGTLNPCMVSYSESGSTLKYANNKSKLETVSDFGIRTDCTNYVNAAPRLLPPSPFRLETHTHFYIKSDSLPRICMIIGQKLCELDTDFHFITNKCKWKVEYRRLKSIQRVEFNINIFKSNTKSHIIELQRRNGDITALMHIFTEFKVFFKRNQMLINDDLKLSSFKQPPVSNTSIDKNNVENAIHSICGLLKSDYDDVKIQGILSVISLTYQHENSTYLSLFVPYLITCGNCKNQNVSKLAQVALSQLCEDSKCRIAIGKAENWEVIIKHAIGEYYNDAETQRASLKLIESLVPMFLNELLKTKCIQMLFTLVKDWKIIQDSRLQKHAYNTHYQLTKAGIKI